jgi:tetratricopeptide (TPR) repeat protein
MSLFDFGNFDDDPEDEERGKERFDDALNRFKDMMKNGSSGLTNIEALEEIIAYYFENEKYEDALHFVNQLLVLVPYSADTWQRKGLILHNLGRCEEALESFDQALRINPVDPELLVSKGIALDEL